MAGPAMAGQQSLWPMVRRWARDLLLVLVPVVAIAGWWYWRNWQLYGEPMGLNACWRSPAAVRSRHRGGSFGRVPGVSDQFLGPVWRSQRTDASRLDLSATRSGHLGAGVGFVVWVWRAWRPQRYAQWPALMLTAAWIVIVFVALLRWTSVTLASQGRLIFPALCSIAFSLPLGGWDGFRSGGSGLLRSP